MISNKRFPSGGDEGMDQGIISFDVDSSVVSQVRRIIILSKFHEVFQRRKFARKMFVQLFGERIFDDDVRIRMGFHVFWFQVR